MLAFILCFAFAKEIYAFLTEPLAAALAGQKNDHLIYTALYETFFTYVKVGAFGGLCLGFPFIAAQLWLFVAPGLYRERTQGLSAVPAGDARAVHHRRGLRLLRDAAFRDQILRRLSDAERSRQLGIELLAKVSDYLDFVMTLIFAFGLTFQMPVLLSLLGRVGILSAQQLRSFRRYAIVAIFAVAAVVTPPDIFSQLSLALPLVAALRDFDPVRVADREEARRSCGGRGVG